ncbi:MAG: oxidoreductase [Betaproteobacteria bacterium]|nr:oxidoreductase [Betaproteobacteria bacterium]
MQIEPFEVRVKTLIWEAPGIVSADLRPLEGNVLPPFTAGAHIDLHLSTGLVRSYSLLNAQSERHRYVIAVQRDRTSRGGSLWIHDKLGAGDVIKISPPRNNFALAEGAPSTIFIAGGIGITPILGMVRQLDMLGHPWQLHYCTRTRAGTAFINELEALAANGRGAVRFNFDEEPGGKMIDLAALTAAAPKDAHLYCCGPLPMLAAFEAATAAWPREQVHVEYFTAKEAPAVAGGFTVVLAKSGREIKVDPGVSIINALFRAGVNHPSSCLEGVCGACETPVLEGIPDHRDLVLTESEQRANRTMMICCSGCKSERLVLDI